MVKLNNLFDFNKKSAMVAMAIVGICWGFASLFIKLTPWSSFQIVAVRSSMAAICLSLYILLVEKKKLVFNKTVLFVGFFVCFKYIFYVSANKLTTAANVVALHQTNIIYILIATCIMNKTKPRGKDILIIIATMVGISLFFFGKFTFSGMIGNLLAAGAGLCTAVLFFMSSKFSSFEENLTSIISGNILAAIISFIMSAGSSFEITPVAIGSILFLGLIQQSFAFITYTKAVRIISPFACAILVSIEPVLSPIVCFLFLGEAPGKFAVLGTIVVIGSILIWSLSDVKNTKKDNL